MIEFPSLPTLGQTHTTYDSEDNPTHWICTNTTGPVWSKNIADIVLGGIENIVNSTTLVDVFIYDTTTDDDGGAWVDQAQQQSWYNEAFSATRGSKKSFPKLAIITLAFDKITIYDGDRADTPMWMVFDVITVGNYMHANNATCIAAKNGHLYWGNDTQGLRSANFIEDYGQAWKRVSNSYQGMASLPISGRNAVSTWRDILENINNATVYDITISSDGDMNNIVVVGTGKGISRIAVDDKISTWNHSVADHVCLNVNISGELLYWTSNTNTTQVLCPTFLAAEPLLNADINEMNIFNTSYNTQWKTNVLPINNSLTTYPSMTGVAKNAIATTFGLTPFEINPTVFGRTLFANITTSFNTGWLRGDIRSCLLANDLTLDRCYLTLDANQIGSALSLDPVMPGAELLAASGFDGSNYIEQPYTAELDFGTGEFMAVLWVKCPSTITLNETIFARRELADTGPYYKLVVLPTGELRWNINGGYVDTLQSLADDTWHHIVVCRSGIYVDGKLNNSADQSGYSGDNATAVLRVGLSTPGTNPFTGSIALLRLMSGNYEVDLLKRSYETEKMLFLDNARCLLQGSSNNVRAIDRSEVDNVLTACSIDHVTRFNDLAVVSDEAIVATSVSRACGNKELLGS